MLQRSMSSNGVVCVLVSGIQFSPFQTYAVADTLTKAVVTLSTGSLTLLDIFIPVSLQLDGLTVGILELD